MHEAKNMTVWLWADSSCSGSQGQGFTNVSKFRDSVSILNQSQVCSSHGADRGGLESGFRIIFSGKSNSHKGAGMCAL